MKFCKDCRHCTSGDSPEYARCHAPQAKCAVVDFVTGGSSTVYLYSGYCGSLRIDGIAACGPDAKWFEPREDAAEAAQ